MIDTNNPIYKSKFGLKFCSTKAFEPYNDETSAPPDMLGDISINDPTSYIGLIFDLKKEDHGKQLAYTIIFAMVLLILIIGQIYLLSIS